jgi:molybdopterin converting factor small subunit
MVNDNGLTSNFKITRSRTGLYILNVKTPWGEEAEAFASLAETFAHLADIFGEAEGDGINIRGVAEHTLSRNNAPLTAGEAVQILQQ